MLTHENASHQKQHKTTDYLTHNIRIKILSKQVASKPQLLQS